MRDDRAFLVWEEAVRFVRERDLDGYAGMFAADGVVELPFPLPGMPHPIDGRGTIRRVLAPVWRAQREIRRQGDPFEPVAIHKTGEPAIVVIEFDLHGVEASGTPYRLSYVHVVTVHEGRVALLRDHADAGAIRQRVRTADGDHNKSLVRRYLEMFRSRNFDRIDQVIAVGCLDHAHPEIVDPAGFVAAAKDFHVANPGAIMTIDTLVAEGDLVAARTTVRCTRDGEVVVASGMAFFRVCGGKLAEQWSCYPSGADGRQLLYGAPAP